MADPRLDAGDTTGSSGSYKVMDNLVRAIKSGNGTLVEQTIEQGYDSSSGSDVSPGIVDSDGNTLMHWAAIYNAHSIMKFLIRNGANAWVSGGIYRETPLQLILRMERGSIATVRLLIEETGATGSELKQYLERSSTLGHTALFTAVQTHQLHAVFLLLTAGASPHAVDNHGDTPLYWLIRQPHSKESTEIQRLLIRFSASVTYQGITDGNNALHILAYMGDNFETQTAELVYMAAAKAIETEEQLLFCKNYENLGPYDAAVSLKNKKMARFLSDVMMYRHFPYWLPILTTAAAGCSFFLCLWYGGWIGGALAALPLYRIGDALSQPSIRTAKSRSQCGLAWMVVCSDIVCYFCTMARRFGASFNGIAALVSLSIVYTFLKTSTTTAKYLQPQQLEDEGSRRLLIDKIVQSAESAGRSSGSSGHFRLCTTCLVDKSLASTHCSECNRCMMSVDHHCLFVCNCIGRGNRRMFTLFLASASLGCSMFVIVALYMTYTEYCPLFYTIKQESMSMWFYVLSSAYSTHLCMLLQYPALLLLCIVTIATTLFILGHLTGQLSLVAAETTAFEMLKKNNKGTQQKPYSVRGLRNIIQFCFTGAYSITNTGSSNGSGGGGTVHSSSTNSSSSSSSSIDGGGGTSHLKFASSKISTFLSTGANTASYTATSSVAPITYTTVNSSACNTRQCSHNHAHAQEV